MITCATCKRRPSERIGIESQDEIDTDTGFGDLIIRHATAPCADSIHDAADELMEAEDASLLAFEQNDPERFQVGTMLLRARTAWGQKRDDDATAFARTAFEAMSRAGVRKGPNPNRTTLEQAEIRNRAIGREVAAMTPPGWRFLLILASSGPDGFMTYLSNVERASAIELLEEMLTKFRSGKEI